MFKLKEKIEVLLGRGKVQQSETSAASLYAKPRKNPLLKNCSFYHHFDLPGVGEVGQGWDLRETIDEYLGITLGVDYQGKRCLDLGAASGFLTFSMEQRGAEVVSYEMESSNQWNLVPYYDSQFPTARIKAAMEADHKRIKTSYWFAHRAFQSSAKMFYGNVYNLPEALGRFDIVMVGMILPHLRDPFQALYSASRLCNDTIVVTQQCPLGEQPYGLFLPNTDKDPDNPESYYAWWVFSEQCLINMLNVLGFETVGTKRVMHKCSSSSREGQDTYEECSTIVAKRRQS